MSKEIENPPILYQEGAFITGMTLRDYFAAKAMQALLSNHVISAATDQIAQAAYVHADAMLSERSKSNE